MADNEKIKDNGNTKEGSKVKTKAKAKVKTKAKAKVKTKGNTKDKPRVYKKHKEYNDGKPRKAYKEKRVLERKGRPSLMDKMTDEEFETIIKEEAGMMTRVATRIGYTDSCMIYKRVNTIEGLKDRINDLYRNNAVAIARDGLIDLLIEGDKDMIKFTLSKLDMDIGFKDNSQIEINVSMAAKDAVDADMLLSFRDGLIGQLNEADREEIEEADWAALDEIEQQQDSNQGDTDD